MIRCCKRLKSYSMTHRRFPKAGLVYDCASHMILAAVPLCGRPGTIDGGCILS